MYEVNVKTKTKIIAFVVLTAFSAGVITQIIIWHQMAEFSEGLPINKNSINQLIEFTVNCSNNFGLVEVEYDKDFKKFMSFKCSYVEQNGN